MFTLHLEEQELDYIAKVLTQRPYGEVAALFAKMQAQINQQQKAAAMPQVMPEPSRSAEGPQGIQPLGPNGSEAPVAYTGP